MINLNDWEKDNYKILKSDKQRPILELCHIYHLNKII